MSQKKVDAEQHARDKAGGCPSQMYYEFPTGEVTMFRCMFQEGHTGTCVGNAIGKRGRIRKTWLREGYSDEG